jgi:uncharacterized protein involved in cysteine biosynthesis
MNAVPCALCGYDAPGKDCPHCGHAPVGKGLGKARSRNVQAILDGAWALPQGLILLAKTRGVKRWLIPPVVLTSLVFLALFIVVMGWVDNLVAGWIEASKQDIPTDAGWWADWLVTLLEWGGTTFTARTVGFLTVFVTSSVVALYTFSIAYEAIAGPFLDEIQGRIEEGWFGHNPRNRIQRPTQLPVERCVKLTLIAGLPTVLLGFAFLLTSGPIAWILLALAPMSFIVAAVREPEYGIWLRWVAKVESATLWVSVKASLLALLILALFFPLKFFFPPFGVMIFFGIAGFSTALTLLDIPFSRRLWSLRKRLRFVFGNLLPMTAFGLVSSFVFLIPVIGPIVMVPAASIGGLWLTVRLDKSSLRVARVKQ